MSLSELWPEVLLTIEKRVSPQNFTTWFLPLKFMESSDDMVTLGVVDRFTKDWITDHNFKEIIQQEFSSSASREIRVHLRVLELVEKHPESSPLPEGSAVTQNPPREDILDVGLNPRYTFDQFVVGSSNQLAFAASSNVAENPGTTYNPLFLYAGPGLGKTHLLNAIGHKISATRKNCRVLYLSSETFVNEFVNSIRLNKMDDFRSKYRSSDVLLIDDIQFISGKEATQEEFFHTFNTMHETRRQIVITSDSYPQEIPELEDRLRTRFQWGLIADIQPPDIETRIAIVHKKADAESLDITDDVAMYIASSVKSNIREIEGSIKRLGAYSSMYGRPINLEFSKEILKDTLSVASAISIETIQKAVSAYFDIKISDLKGDRRLRSVSRPRQVAMYLCRQLVNASFPDIGVHFNKDHSSAISACRNIEKLQKIDPIIRDAVQAIRRQLGV